MQCFQKDPNLRVSARKLLKHPWIVNAKRSDAVVPKKPTQYDEAVKSVQEWNEALKSPNASSLRRASRPMSSSPIPGRREPPHAQGAPARTPTNVVKPRVNTEQFSSPSNTADDNWDDDFASAISPSALQLPHLKPRDNFGGLLSSERLKAFASFETATEEANWDDNFEGDLTVRNSLHVNESDPLETIRPSYQKHPGAQQSKSTPATAKSPESVLPVPPAEPPPCERRFSRKKSPMAARKATKAPAVHQKHSSPRAKQTAPSTQLFVEIGEEDCSDLIADEAVFNRRTSIRKVKILNFYHVLR